MDINEPTNEDVSNSIVKGLIGTIPVVGALATELFGLIVVPPLEKRRVEWMNEIASRLKNLEDKHLLTLESLKDNEQFIDTILQTTTYVLKTSEEEKILAFQNALLNTALPEAPEKTKSQIFLNQLDNFTVWHIRILQFLDSPRQWFIKRGMQVPDISMGIGVNVLRVLREAFPEIRSENTLIEIIIKDLANVGVVDGEDMRGMVSSPTSVLARRTTKFGQEFLDFITDKNN